MSGSTTRWSPSIARFTRAWPAALQFASAVQARIASRISGVSMVSCGNPKQAGPATRPEPTAVRRLPPSPHRVPTTPWQTTRPSSADPPPSLPRSPPANPRCCPPLGRAARGDRVARRVPVDGTPIRDSAWPQGYRVGSNVTWVRPERSSRELPRPMICAPSKKSVNHLSCTSRAPLHPISVDVTRSVSRRSPRRA